ncbi:autotransporter outer membrane beta-barrel domain-containing protein [Cupriavidus pampae]|uniref:Autotransporter domain-containing protein n=1 Tax=Cupriavidus pampae TaxID=659251 RepID=A0ABN7ZI64_9BURK|nr:autotransporter outer membrane beta-barrel domain-containing protein [Cupriavidus pampae]CAG9185668.1 hypothetical protein LMG32289_06039 [Cupriavidus pampae]
MKSIHQAKATGAARPNGRHNAHYLLVGVAVAGLTSEADAQTCTTIGTGQVSATDTCTVGAASISTTAANPIAMTGTGTGANLTDNGTTLGLSVANAIGVNALAGARINFNGGSVNTTSNTAALANGQIGLRATGAGSSIFADSVQINMRPAAGVSLSAVRAEDGGTVTLSNTTINIGSAGSGRNFNHGLVASGANSNIFATGINVTAASNFSNAARAELGGTVTLVSSTLAATGAGNAVSGPAAAASALSGGTLVIRGANTILSGGVSNQSHGLFVSDVGSTATVSDATILAVGGSNSNGVFADNGGSAAISSSTISSATSRGVWVTNGASVSLTNTTVTSAISNAVAAGAGGSVTIDGGRLENSGQVPTLSVGGVNTTATTHNTAIISTGNANAPGVYVGTDALATINGGTVDTFGTTERGQRVKGIAANTPNARLIANDLGIHTHGDEAIGVAADDGGTVTLNRSTVLTDGRNAIGVYAGVDPTKPGQAVVVANASAIETFGEIAHGAQAQAQTSLAIPATVTLNDNTSVITHGAGAVGLRAVLKGKVEALQGSNVTTEGSAAHGMLALGDQSLVILNGATVTTSGIAAHGGVARDSGRISGTNATVTATNANAAALYVAADMSPTSADFTTSALSNRSGPTIAIAGAGTVSLVNSTVSGSGEWLRVGTPADFPTLPAPENPIARPEPVPPGEDPSTPPADLLLSAGALSTIAKTPQALDTFATVDASGSMLIGSAITMPGSTSTVTLRNSTQWDLTGNSNLTNLTNDASRILFSTPVAGAFKTLTVSNYAGANGALIGLNTVLAADNSPSDKLVIDGGKATGGTGLRITNAGGAGALTQANGIMVVDAVNGGTTTASAFVLSGRAVAGPYEYRLFRSSIDSSNPQAWYLRSDQTPAPPVPPPNPDVIPVPPTPLYRPEVAAYLANQRLAAGFLVHSLHDRLGEPQWTEQQRFDNDDQKRGAGWVRLVGKDIGSRSRDGNFDVNSDVWMLQGGGDVASWSVFRGDDRIHVGGMLGYSWGSSTGRAAGNPATADSDVQGVNVGVYGTWFQNDKSRLGWYTDLWAQYGWYTNHVNGQSLPTVKYDSRVLALSAETGYAWYARHERDWVIEPQGQVIFVRGHENGVTEPNGTRIDGGDGSGWITRLGVRLHRTWIHDSGKRTQPYLTVNWWHDAVDNVLTFNQVSLRDMYPQNRYEIKIGINVEQGKGWTGWGNAGWQFGSQSYHAFIGRLGVKYAW